MNSVWCFSYERKWSLQHCWSGSKQNKSVRIAMNGSGTLHTDAHLKKAPSQPGSCKPMMGCLWWLHCRKSCSHPKFLLWNINVWLFFWVSHLPAIRIFLKRTLLSVAKSIDTYLPQKHEGSLRTLQRRKRLNLAIRHAPRSAFFHLSANVHHLWSSAAMQPTGWQVLQDERRTKIRPDLLLKLSHLLEMFSNGHTFPRFVCCPLSAAPYKLAWRHWLAHWCGSGSAQGEGRFVRVERHFAPNIGLFKPQTTAKRKFSTKSAAVFFRVVDNVKSMFCRNCWVYQITFSKKGLKSTVVGVRDGKNPYRRTADILYLHFTKLISKYWMHRCTWKKFGCIDEDFSVSYTGNNSHLTCPTLFRSTVLINISALLQALMCA